MARFRVKVTGVDEVIARIKNLEDIESHVKPIVNKSLADMYNRAENLTPYLTGELLGSRFIKMNGLEGWFGYSKEYAPFVEYGHRIVIHGKNVGFRPANPYLKPFNICLKYWTLCLYVWLKVGAYKCLI